MTRPRPSKKPKGHPSPVTKATFARRAGRGKSTITEACAGPLKPALVHGGRIDVTHAAVATWARDRGIDPATLRDPGTTAPAAPTGHRLPPLSEPADVDDINHYTVAQVTEKFGSVLALEDWVSVRKLLGATKKLELANAEKEGLVISRELVRQHILGLIDSTWSRLTRDASQTIAHLVGAAARADRPHEELVSIAREQVSQHLRHVKGKALRALGEEPAAHTEATAQ